MTSTLFLSCHLPSLRPRQPDRNPLPNPIRAPKPLLPTPPRLSRQRSILSKPPPTFREPNLQIPLLRTEPPPHERRGIRRQRGEELVLLRLVVQRLHQLRDRGVQVLDLFQRMEMRRVVGQTADCGRQGRGEGDADVVDARS